MEMSNAEEWFKTAETYLHGYGVAIDKNYAVAMYQKAAEDGYQPAIERLRELNFPVNYGDSNDNISFAIINDEKDKMSSTEIVQLFNKRIAAIENLAKKIDDVQKKCAEAEIEVRNAKNCDFKGIIFDDQTKAIEYLQDACIALSNSQISTQEALDLFFQYQIIVAEMINRLLAACFNNYNSMQVLQKEIERYLKTQNKRNSAMDQVIQPLLDLQSRLQQDSAKLQEMAFMRKQMQKQAQQLNLLTNKNKAISENVKKNNGGSNTTTIIIGILALIASLAAIMGLRF